MNRNLFPNKLKPLLTIKKSPYVITKDSIYPTKKTTDFISKYPKGKLTFFRQFSSWNPIDDLQIDPSLTEEQAEEFQLKTLRLHICEIHKYIDAVTFKDKNHRKTVEEIDKEIEEKYYYAKPEDLENIENYVNPEEYIESPENSPSNNYDPPDPE